MENEISSNGIIRMNRGDTLYMPFLINQGSLLQPFRYVMEEGDTLYFAVMEPHQPFEQALIKKVYTKDSEMTEEGDIIIKLLPEDTEYVKEGTYYYTIKLRQIRDTVDNVTTIVPKTFFYIV